jgi:flagellar hook assembly protein FlgD
MPAGEHLMSWDGRDDAGQIVPSGTYLFRLENGVQVQTKKLVLVK